MALLQVMLQPNINRLAGQVGPLFKQFWDQIIELKWFESVNVHNCPNFWDLASFKVSLHGCPPFLFGVSWADFKKKMRE